MVSGHIKATGLREVQLATRTQKLERAYLECVQGTNATQALEERRRLRLRITLLQTENDDLYEEIEKYKDDECDLMGERDDFKEQKWKVEQLLERVREDLRIKTRQVDSLKAEREGLRGQSTDSSKLLVEKNALLRELANVKPELERLRSQLALNQNAVSEKQSLQRQLRALEVELENEKRARKQGSDRSDSSAHDLQARNETLEARLDTFRTKLKQTKEQLTEANRQLKTKSTKEKIVAAKEPEPEVELEPEPEPEPEPQSEPEPEPEPEPEVEPELEALPNRKANVKKRSFEQIEQDTSIGTPGDLPNNKRGKRVTTQPGEKSSFSITPFLNRTGNPALDSPASSPTRPRASIAQGKAASKKIPIAASPEFKPRPVKPKPKSLGTASASRGNARSLPDKRSAARSLSAPKLDKVIEEDENQENEGNEDSPRKSEGASIPAPQPTVFTNGGNKPLIKKKKLIGKTIFDDDEEGPVRPMGMGFLNAKGAASGLGKSSIGPFKFGAVPGKPVATFGAFSPLKKDKRMAAA